MNLNYLDVLAVEQGLIMRIEIPLATNDSVFTVCLALAVTMPQLEKNVAVSWNLEALYLAISKNNEKTPFQLTSRDGLARHATTYIQI